MKGKTKGGEEGRRGEGKEGRCRKKGGEEGRRGEGKGGRGRKEEGRRRGRGGGREREIKEVTNKWCSK